VTRRAAQVRPGDADLETAGGVYACVLSAARAESAPRSEPAPDDAVTRVRTLLQLQMVHRCLRAFLSASAPPRLRASASPRLRVSCASWCVRVRAHVHVRRGCMRGRGFERAHGRGSQRAHQGLVRQAREEATEATVRGPSKATVYLIYLSIYLSIYAHTHTHTS
jgi:hypothetical protein